MLAKLPIQPAGWVVLGVGIASALGALLLNWRELLVLAIGCGAILIVSLAFIIGRSEIRLERRLENDRVSVGDDAVVELVATNSGSVRTNKQTIVEAIDGASMPVELPPLSPNADTVVDWSPPTQRRGRYQLGPARITKTDPCRLMQRDVGQTGVDEFWVQPRVVLLPSFVGGLTKDVDGPTFDHSPAGDVAATARAGEMMVKQYVDNRQPHVTVLLDTNQASWSDRDEFDVGVEIAASLGVSSLEASQPGTVFAGMNQLVGAGRRSNRRLLLDDLTLVNTDYQYELGELMGPQVAGERNTTIAVLITGASASAEELQIPATRLAQTCAVFFVRVHDGAQGDDGVIAARGVRYVSVSDLDDFASLVRGGVTA